jgi:hypothetical protein
MDAARNMMKEVQATVFLPRESERRAMGTAKPEIYQ